jgi:hypothetical protein
MVFDEFLRKPRVQDSHSRSAKDFTHWHVHQVEFSQVFQRLKLVIRPRIRRLSDG